MRRLGPRGGPVGALSTLYSRTYECQTSNKNIFLKYNDNKTCNARLVWYLYYMNSPLKKCPKCRELKPSRQIQHRDSYHVYAGYFCEECCCCAQTDHNEAQDIKHMMITSVCGVHSPIMIKPTFMVVCDHHSMG